MKDHASRLLKSGECKRRQCVYSNQRIRATVLEIVKILSDKHITVGRYFDAILFTHIEVHKDEV